jgi:hypothetical protein
MRTPRNLIYPLVVASALWAQPARAELIKGIEFPLGNVSFADAVVSYAPVMVGSGPTAPHRDPTHALGRPDYAGQDACPTAPACTFVSLGDGGTLTLQFTDNVLTGGGDSRADLWIFEVGPDVEDMFVEISRDGVDWLAVGKVGGSTAGVDIDAFGYGVADSFAWVRVRDDPALDGQSGATVGADIDAIGAISTRQLTSVPEPESLALVLVALLAAARSGTRRPS